MTDRPADILRPLRQTRQFRQFEPTPVPADILDALADVARWTGASEPDDRMVRTVVQVGIPTAAARAPKSGPGEARLPREETVFRDRWPAG